jgi:hypothetical protein
MIREAMLFIWIRVVEIAPLARMYFVEEELAP